MAVGMGWGKIARGGVTLQCTAQGAAAQNGRLHACHRTIREWTRRNKGRREARMDVESRPCSLRFLDPHSLPTQQPQSPPPPPTPLQVVFVELGRASFTGYPPSDASANASSNAAAAAPQPSKWPNSDFVVSYQVGARTGGGWVGEGEGKERGRKGGKTHMHCVHCMRFLSCA